VARNVADGRLSFTTDLADAVRRSVIVFITVGTPPKENGQADLGAVEDVARTIGQAMERYTVVVNKSTCPSAPATSCATSSCATSRGRSPSTWSRTRSSSARLGDRGHAEPRPDRDRRADPAGRHDAAGALRAARAPMIITDVPRGDDQVRVQRLPGDEDLVRQRIANICEAAGADVAQVMKGVGWTRASPRLPQRRPRVRGQLLPEGHRLPHPHRQQLGYDFALLRAVVDINRERAGVFVEKIEKALSPLDGRTIAVLGLAFKPNTDDMREAKSLEVVARLLAGGATVRTLRPRGDAQRAPDAAGRRAVLRLPLRGGEGCRRPALLTEWNEFKLLNLERLRALMRRPVVFDGRTVGARADAAHRLRVPLDRPAVRPPRMTPRRGTTRGRA